MGREFGKVGDDEVHGTTGAELAHVPDLRLTGADADDRIHLAVDPLLPAFGVAIAIIRTAVRTSHLFILAIDGDIHLRENQVHLPERVLVLRPRLKRIADHDHAGQTTLNLLLGLLVHVRVIPVGTHAIFVGGDRDLDRHRLAWLDADIDIVRLAQGGCVRTVVVEIGREDRIGGIVANGKIIDEVKFQRVAAIDLQHRARKARRVRRAVGVELIGHGVRVVVTVIIREAAVDLLPAVEDRIGVEARRDHPHVGLEHAVLALDHIQRPQLCLLGCIFGGENDVACSRLGEIHKASECSDSPDECFESGHFHKLLR